MREEELDALYHALLPRPTGTARVESLNVRPGPAGQREEREQIELNPIRGAIGDRWEQKTWLHLPDGRPDPRVQLALCNTTLLALMQHAAGTQHHPGDTIFTNLDLSAFNLPAGSRLQAGSAIIEISNIENDACAKFVAHYGDVIFRWIRRPDNRPLRLRGAFARVVATGIIRRGDAITRV